MQNKHCNYFICVSKQHEADLLDDDWQRRWSYRTNKQRVKHTEDEKKVVTSYYKAIIWPFCDNSITCYFLCLFSPSSNVTRHLKATHESTPMWSDECKGYRHGKFYCFMWHHYRDLSKMKYTNNIFQSWLKLWKHNLLRLFWYYGIHFCCASNSIKVCWGGSRVVS